MKILVLHQLPDRKANYRQAIDHTAHDVTYIGHQDRLAELPPDLPCRQLPLEPDEDIVDGIKARLGPHDGFEALISLSEFGILAAAHARQYLGIDGPDLHQALRTHDKIRMKEALAGSHVRTPRFLPSLPTGAVAPWTGKTVLKPRQGTCSQGVEVYTTAREAAAAQRALDDPDAYQLEEYIAGDLLHADGLVSAGRLTHVVTSRYVNKPLDFADGRPLGSHQLPPDPRHHHFASRAVEALGITSGSVHLEYFETPQGEFVFLEIANRMGGAGVVTAHMRHTGIHLPSHEIALRLGLPSPPPTPPTGRFHGWLVVPGHHLAHTKWSINVPRWLHTHPCLDTLHVLDPTSPLPDQITYQEWLVPLAIEASHPDPDHLAAFLHHSAQALSVRMSEAA